jgi:hypothetical protein
MRSRKTLVIPARLDYNALKKRFNSADPQDSSGREPATAFVELVPLQRG